ncbi:MAG TPA: polysaccharide biosynthesis protein, partial [Capillimicrobium sp.]
MRRLRSAAPPLHRHSIPQIAADGVLVAFAYWLAFTLRFDRGIPPNYEQLLRETWWWVVVASLVVFVASRMYARWWRYVGQRDLLVVVRSVLLVTLAAVTAVGVLHPVTRETDAGLATVNLPSSVVALFFLLAVGMLCGLRLLARIVHERPRGFRPAAGARSVLIVGAGDGGRLLLREMARNRELNLNPVGFVDDDPTKRRIRIEGVRVLGTTFELSRVLDEVEPDEVMIAIPSAPGTLRARVVGACRKRGIPVRTL